MKRPALGLLILLGVLLLNQIGGLPVFSGPGPADGVWLRVLGGEWGVGFLCAALTSAVLLAIGRRRHRA